MSIFLTLIGSFCLSAIAYDAAQPREVPVQHYEFEEHIIQPAIQYYDFDEIIILAQADDADDGDSDGIDWDQNSDFWCLTHPDECDIELLTEEEELEDGC
tara:strand:- start:1086 stop:1385 length:300 start_codon:yes stop_codon:yes gene_type:complete